MRALLLVFCLLVPVTASAQGPGTDELLRRLEAAEARIRALEERLETTTPAPVAAAASTAEAPPERPITHQSVSLAFNGLVQAWYAAGN